VGEVIRSGVVKTRKPHRCWGCTIEIPAGSLVDSQTFEDMGTITTAYFCDTCSEMLSECDDGCCYGDMQEEAEKRRAEPAPSRKKGARDG
jgi:hypothetical protein